eukprot:SAG31_NODE_46893_length_252_cov_1.013072_1_plen_27_part_10
MRTTRGRHDCAETVQHLPAGLESREGP